MAIQAVYIQVQAHDRHIRKGLHCSLQSTRHAQQVGFVAKYTTPNTAEWRSWLYVKPFATLPTRPRQHPIRENAWMPGFADPTYVGARLRPLSKGCRRQYGELHHGPPASELRSPPLPTTHTPRIRRRSYQTSNLTHPSADARASLSGSLLGLNSSVVSRPSSLTPHPNHHRSLQLARLA